MNTTIRRAVPLDRWSGHAWTDGFQIEALAPLDTLAVCTRNSRYEITILSPATGEVLVRGGQFFPEFTRVTVSGSSLGNGCLKVRGVYVGFYLEFAHEGQTVRTTRVREAIKGDRPAVH
jgi:hypothetical protein